LQGHKVLERNFMKFKTWIFSLMAFAAAGLLLSGTVRSVQADGDGGNIVFKNTKSFAPVVFSHQNHKSVGMVCNDCHDALFKKKQGSTDVDNVLTMKALRKGKYCGSCHDGSRAFSVRKHCKKCHQK